MIILKEKLHVTQVYVRILRAIIQKQNAKREKEKKLSNYKIDGVVSKIRS